MTFQNVFASMPDVRDVVSVYHAARLDHEPGGGGGGWGEGILSYKLYRYIQSTLSETDTLGTCSMCPS